jgi:hypothetical protein
MERGISLQQVEHRPCAMGNHVAFGLDEPKRCECARQVRELGDGIRSPIAASSDEDLAATCACVRHGTA